MDFPTLSAINFDFTLHCDFVMRMCTFSSILCADDSYDSVIIDGGVP